MLMKGSGKPEKDRGGRNLRRSVADGVENPRIWRRFKDSQVDSLDGDDEEDEPHLLVTSARRGVACCSGAMERYGQQGLVVVEKKQRRGKRHRGWRREGGRKLGFPGARGRD